MKYSKYFQTKKNKKYILVDLNISENLKEKIIIAPERINLDKWLNYMDKYNKHNLFSWSFGIINNIENKIATLYLNKIILRYNNVNLINDLPNDIITYIKSFYICNDFPIFKHKKSINLISELNVKLID